MVDRKEIDGESFFESQDVSAFEPAADETLPVRTGSEPKTSPDECLDRWLAEQKLDAFGSPEGTVYAGGAPTFDETTGAARTRWDHVVAKHPGLARACDGARGR